MVTTLPDDTSCANLYVVTDTSTYETCIVPTALSGTLSEEEGTGNGANGNGDAILDLIMWIVIGTFVVELIVIGVFFQMTVCLVLCNLMYFFRVFVLLQDVDS